MLYPDGTNVNLADRVKLINGELGTVVCSIDAKTYSTEFSEQDWAYLKEGVMVRTDAGALVHFKDPNTGDIQRVQNSR